MLPEDLCEIGLSDSLARGRVIPAAGVWADTAYILLVVVFYSEQERQARGDVWSIVDRKER
jgi:hypothetical protein